MKKFMIYILFVLICGLSIFFGYRYMQSSAYEQTAVPYLKQVLPEISSWEPARVRACMAPEVLEGVSDEKLSALLTSLSRIGTLEHIEDISFKNKASGEHITRDQQPLVTYELKARYSSGEVGVTISLLDKGEDFDVYHFNFQSEALAPTGN